MMEIDSYIREKFNECKTNNPEKYREMNNILLRLSVFTKKDPVNIIKLPLMKISEKNSIKPQNYLDDIFEKEPTDFYRELGYKERMERLDIK